MRRKYQLVVYIMVFCIIVQAQNSVYDNLNLVKQNAFSPGLLFPDGIEPGNPEEGEAPSGNTNWYVDSDAPDGGDGSYENPFNSFEEVVGYWDNEEGKYVIGSLRGGDYLYVKGTFKASEHDLRNNNMKIELFRGLQGGTPQNPTVIKSWKGSPRAVFDGEHTLSDLIHVKWFDEQKIVIQNIEIYRAYGRGIWIDERVGYVDIISVEAHHTANDPMASTGGGLSIKMVDVLNDYNICHCVVHDNIQNVGGGSSLGGGGGIHILSEGWATNGSTINLFNNIVYKENYGIGHKHSGNIAMNAYNNIVSDSKHCFSLRAYHQNYVHHNIMIKSLEGAFLFSKENLQGDFTADLYNNTFIDCNGAISTTSDQSDYAMEINFYDNIYYSLESENVISLARWSSNYFDINGWNSTNNIFYHPETQNFLYHQGNNYDFEDAMDYVSDSVSITTDPLFEDLANLDFRIKEQSPARSFGTNGKDVGALPYGTEIEVGTSDLLTSEKGSEKAIYVISNKENMILIKDRFSNLSLNTGRYSISLYNSQGRKVVSSIQPEYVNSGLMVPMNDARVLAKGLYFIQIENSMSITKKYNYRTSFILQ